VRAVTDPFKERTEIRGETVSILRAGKSPRKFSLKRAPELRSMIGGFGAVLGGSRDSLEKDFNVDATGDPQAWKLALTPKSPQVGKYVRDIVIQGAKSEARCIVITQPDDQSSVMLVGAASESKLPSPLAREWLTGLCSKG
jgi:hypothetical protein